MSTSMYMCAGSIEFVFYTATCVGPNLSFYDDSTLVTSCGSAVGGWQVESL